MNTTETLKRIKELKEKKEREKKLKKYKKYILKIFPNSNLRINEDSKYYISDSTGRRLLSEEYRIPDCDNPYDTWEKTYNLLWTKHIVDRNNMKFSPERDIDFTSKKIKNNF